MTGRPWAATHRHRKGGLYRELARGVLEADRSDVVIYDDAEGAIWVRSAAEFDDGRFAPVAPGPPAPRGWARVRAWLRRG